MSKAVLIIGEDPSLIDFDAPGAPANMTATKVMAGLNGSVDRLKAAGHHADLLLTTNRPVGEAVAKALARVRYDVVVVGAGLRTLPSMAEKFEQIINALHEQATQANFAFNSKPDDSDTAAMRFL
jgi:hypothetical protein